MSERDDAADRRIDRQVLLTVGVQAVVVLAIIGLLVGLLLVGVMKTRVAANRVATQGQLYQIGYAIQNFDDTNGRLPQADRKTEDSRPGLSWRVELLPFLGNDHLHEQFRFDEPWDGPTNRPLMTKKNPYAASGEPVGTSSRIRMFVGPKTIYDPDAKQPPSLRHSFPDGRSNTLLIVEADEAVAWTKADESVYDPNGPLPSLSKRFKSGAEAVFADRKYRTLPPTIPESTLRLLIMPADGQPIPNW